MKILIKIEIVILVLALLAGTAMVLISEGVLNLFYDPIVIEHAVEPIPTDAAVEPVAAEEIVPEETKAEKKTSSRTITAQKYFAYDTRDNAFVSTKGDVDAKLYPASITKLLTSYVVLQHMKPEDTVKAGDALELVQPDSSVAGLEEGDKLTVEQLIAAMMLPSGNDAAQVAAVAAGRVIAGDKNLDYKKAVDVFMDEMNKQAQAIGMKNSHFVTPDGFHDSNHYTTMSDLVLLSKKVLTNQTIVKYASSTKSTVQLSGRKLEWKNTNAFLHSDSTTYLPNTVGLKTGYTDKAGNCLVSAFFMEDRMLIIGVFGCAKGNENRYLDSLAIYNSI